MNLLELCRLFKIEITFVEKKIVHSTAKTEYQVLRLVKSYRNTAERKEMSGEGLRGNGEKCQELGMIYSFPQDTLLVLKMAGEQLAPKPT